MMKDKYRVLINSCWILLFICLILKLFGANIFEPYTDNKTFINLCNFIDGNLCVKYILYAIFSLCLNSLFVFSVMKEKFYTKIQAIVFIPLIITMAQLILNLIFYITPIIFDKKIWKRLIVGIILTILFQVMSIVIKNIGKWNLNEEKTLIVIIMQIDTYIMMILYYLYSNFNRKEVK